MALPSTLFRIKMDLSDMDRNVYQSLDLRVAQHPSEDLHRVAARVLAYALVFEEGLEFGRGLSSTEDAALWTHDLTGRLLHWIDVGTPSGERLHMASKRTDRVTVLCHKGKDALLREMKGKNVHRAEQIDVLLVEPEFAAALGDKLSRNAELSLVVSDGELTLNVGEEMITGALERAVLSDLS